ncbi:hypothetical protein ACFFKH_15790 [Micromonospora marina]|uniref:Uncharacterized protein n=1 Tax=Micromonospora marina TaxID=307120 RepID=A0A1C4VG80_9ACTN|nr:hypothetical protein [Micromonospora marina]SCE83003.1 hypothetical protein GA0070215_103147 [Micromonospora marina]
MSYADLSSAQWNDLSDGAAGRIAEDIAARHELTVVGTGDRAYAGLTIATAFRDEDFGRWSASDEGYADEILTRPVIELG